MKKLLALVLAVALSLSMASVAFAAFDFTAKTAAPGDELLIPVSLFNALSDVPTIKNEYLSTDYFTIKVEYSRGKELVKEVKFSTKSGEEGVKIVLKDDVLERPTVANFQIKSVTLTGKKDGVDKANENYRGKKYELAGTTVVSGTATLNTAITAGYDKTEVVIKDSFDVAYNEASITKFVNKTTADPDGKDYGIATINFNEKASAEVRVYKDEKFFLGVKGDADLDIVKANPDADLEFLTFTGNPTFSANAKVEIYAEEDTFLYEIKDGKLVESSFKYDEDAAAFVGKARTLGKYVISDMKLVAAATTEEAKNPDTGANDVVGVAVALAVVSLVAAGAVSLKK